MQKWDWERERDGTVGCVLTVHEHLHDILAVAYGREPVWKTHRIGSTVKLVKEGSLFAAFVVHASTPPVFTPHVAGAGFVFAS